MLASDLQQLLNLTARKEAIDQKSTWSAGSSTYFAELQKEIEEVREEIDSNRSCYLEDELGDVIWDFMNLLRNLEAEGKISVASVLRRSAQKYEERIGALENGDSWNEVKKIQKARLAEELRQSSR